GGAVRALNAGHLAEQPAAVFIDDHHPILAADEQPMCRRVWHDVIPAAVTTEHVGVRDPVRRSRLREHGRRRGEREDEWAAAHASLLQTAVRSIETTARGAIAGAGVDDERLTARGRHF